MSVATAAIVITGEEIVTGKALDLNGSFLSRELNRLGFQVRSITAVGDSAADIRAELERTAAQNELVLCSGGLGPTSDDCTRDAIAALCSKPLVQSEAALEKLKTFFEKRGRKLNDLNLRQTFFPEGAEVVENSFGTADAFIVRTDQFAAPIVALPGVPRELAGLFEERVGPWIASSFSCTARSLSVLRIFGLSEAHIASCIEKLDLPKSCGISYRASFPEIRITVSRSDGNPGGVSTAEAAGLIARAVGEEFVFSRSEEVTLAQSVIELLLKEGEQLAVAESCTGGRIADRIVAVPGASAVFRGSVVAYANEAKEVFLGVHYAMLENAGAVSAETALEMARNVRRRVGADIGVSTTGVAGPGGGTDRSPLGRLWIGLSTPRREQALSFQLNWDREMYREYAAALALELVRRDLLDLPLEWERL